MDYANGGPPPYSPPPRPGLLARSALGLAGGSFALLFIAYIGWFADVVMGPVAFGVAVAAVVKALRKDTDKGMAFSALALSTPALVWAVYAVSGGRF